MSSSSNKNKFKLEQIFELKYYTSSEPTLLELLQWIFEDFTIYNDEQIKKLVKNSNKGFVKISDIMKLSHFIDFMEKYPNSNITPNEIIKQINEKSKKLVAMNYQIRRVIPFEDMFQTKKMTMIYFQSFKPDADIQYIYTMVQSILGTFCKIIHKKLSSWVIVLTDNYQAIQGLTSIQYDGYNVKIKKPQESIKAYSQRQRLDIDFLCRKMYSKKNPYSIDSYDNDNQENQNITRNYDAQNIPFNYDEDMSDSGPGEESNGEDSDGNDCNEDSKKQRKFWRFSERELFRKGKYFKAQQRLQFEMRQREMEVEHERRRKQKIEKIMNFDNSSLLCLRNPDVAVQDGQMAQ